eukprot:14720536-Alexandrium_andersonii.AAC.1
MGGTASIQQLGAPPSSAPGHSVGGLSPLARRPLRSGSKGTPNRPQGKGRALVATGRVCQGFTPHQLYPSCTASASMV